MELEAFTEIVKEYYEQISEVPQVLSLETYLKKWNIYFPLKILL